MFVGYTRKYSMAVWTGYSNRLTPIVGDGFYVAAKVYRSMMTYLSEDNNPGDWTMPEGLYRSGEFVFKRCSFCMDCSCSATGPNTRKFELDIRKFNFTVKLNYSKHE